MVLEDAKLAKIAQANVLVVGDSMLDRYWVGDVNRISPEAPVPIISVIDEQWRLGGAANVAMNMASVGGQPVLLSIVGDDEAGHKLDAMLSESNIVSQLQFDNELKTTEKLRLISRNQQIVRADFESTPNAAALQNHLKQFNDLIEQFKVVLVSDYGKGGTRNISKMIKSAQRRGIAIYVDPKGSDYSAYTGASLITPNLSEFQQVMGAVESFEDINSAAQTLMDKYNISACLVTLSERGMLLCSRGEEPIHQATRAREVYDVTGAGDTVIAMMAMAKAAKLDQQDALALANHAAGVVVNKMGTATASLDEIKISMQRG